MVTRIDALPAVTTTLVLAVLSLCNVVRADQYWLVGGGQLQATRVDTTDPVADVISLRTRQGIRLTLAADQIQRSERCDAAREAYQMSAPRFADSIDGQWEAAQWCRQQRLSEERKIHLQRILQLDPDYGPARWGLGYTQIGSRWLTQEQFMRERGYQYHEGRWRLTQEIQLLEEQQVKDNGNRTWLLNLKRWRTDVVEHGSVEAAERIRTIDDPAAVGPLARYCAREPVAALQMLYIEALGRIDGPAATRAMIELSLNVSNEEVFDACLERLVPRDPSAIGEAYQRALRDNNNARVNRAALALGRLKHPASVPALIEALVTSHVVVWPPPQTRGSAVSSTFGRLAGGFGTGDTPLGGADVRAGQPSGARIVHTRNREVLSALVELTSGTNFGYDQKSWRVWYQIQTRSQVQPLFSEN